MSCRYLDDEGHEKICTACQPLRPPTRAELKALCQAEEQTACDFYRFRRATGRPLLLEDYLAWQQRRRELGPVTEADLIG